MATKYMNAHQITLRSRQLNPCDVLFWKSRGYTDRPWNWKEILEEMHYYSSEEDSYEEDADYSDEEEYYDDDEDYSDEEDYYDDEEDYSDEEDYYDDEEDYSDEDYYDDEEDYSDEEEDYSDEEEYSSYRDAHQIALRSRQLNPCDVLFWKSRGYPDRPWNWKDILEKMHYYRSRK